MTRRAAILAALALAIVTRAFGLQPASGPVSSEEVGSALVRAAMIDLGLHAGPGVADYEIAAELLRIGSDLRPADAEAARLLAAAGWSAGDRALLLEATRRVVRLDPADTVAQLRLISAGINERQTVEDRLNAFDRFLGPEGRTLDPSVRSRLALDAALLHRETGDAAGFERRLLGAVELDPTNKDAVSLAARTFTTEQTPAKEVAAWQIRLLYADPLDPHVHMTIGRICAGQAALDAASRFFENAARLFRMGMGETPTALREMQLALQWQRGGAPGVVAALNAPLRDARDQAARVIQARVEANEPIGDLRRPEEIRFEPGIDLIRLFAAHEIGDEQTVVAALTDLGNSATETLTTIRQYAGRPDVDQNQLAVQLLQVFHDFQVARAVVGRDAALIREQIDQFFGAIPEAKAMLAPLDAWIAYAEGNDPRALELVGEPRPGTLDDLLIALASERMGDRTRAAPIYLAYARARAMDAFGALARSRLKAMGRDAEVITPAGRDLESALSKVPAWLDRMSMDPATFMMLRTDTPASTVAAHDESMIRVTLRNTASIPLGLGASRPIGSRLLLAPRPISPLADFAGAPTPKVVELDRRLRLEPLSEVAVITGADSAYTGWLREVNAHISLRDRYRVIQGFQPSPRGGLINAPLSLVTESGIVQRLNLALAREGVETLIEAVRTDDPGRLREALTATVARTVEPGDGLDLSEKEIEAVAGAWADRFADANAAERALMLLRLPHARQVPGMRLFDERALDTLLAEAAENGGDPAGGTMDTALLAATMLTRVSDPENAVFELAARSEDAGVRRLGALLRARLAEGRPAFATARPGAAGLAPAGSFERAGMLP